MDMGSEIAAAIAAFLVAVTPGSLAIAWLRKLGAKQTVSADAPQSHGAKQGTPTMGGLLVLGSVAAVTLVYFFMTQLGAHRHPVEDFTLLPVLLLTMAFGAIGFLDDFLSARRGKNLGLRAREKFGAQCIAAIAFLLWLKAHEQPALTTSVVLVPVLDGLGGRVVDLGVWYYVLGLLFIVGLSNATNFTDGLDGLLSGVSIIMCVALSGLVAQSLVPSLSVYCFIIAGALCGFLWWNAHPARVFMGDTGSLALGAGLAGVAMIGKREVGLSVASLVCWAELFAVIIQVTVFKYRRKRHGLEYAKAHRVFRRSPLHHHFEELGWPETQVVTRFWIAGAICALVSMLWSRG
jgi:phospho-N-acetylmuramoyl-pentapeptide-transferase